MCASVAGRGAAFIASLTRRRPHLKAVLSWCTLLSPSLYAVKTSSCELSDAVRDRLTPLRCDTCAVSRESRCTRPRCKTRVTSSLGCKKEVRHHSVRLQSQGWLLRRSKRAALEARPAPKGEQSRRGQLHTAPTLPKSAHPRPKSLKTPTSKPPPRRRGSHHHKRQPQTHQQQDGPRRPQGPAALFQTPHF